MIQLRQNVQLMRGIRSFFAFEDDAAGFEGSEFMPDAFGDVYTVDAVFLTINVPLEYFKVIINPLSHSLSCQRYNEHHHR